MNKNKSTVDEPKYKVIEPETQKPVSEEGVEEMIKSFIRSCVEGYQDAKINGKKIENFHGLVNMGQFKEWCNYIFQDKSDWRLTHFQPEPKPTGGYIWKYKN